MDKKTLVGVGSFLGIITILVCIGIIGGITGLRLILGDKNTSEVSVVEETPSPSPSPTLVETPVAVVGNDPISQAEFRLLVRYTNFSYLETYKQYVQYFGDEANIRQQYQSAMDNIGQSVQQALVGNLLVRQEAARRGIVVTEQEIVKAIQAGLGYFPDGTPTPFPTFTPIPGIPSVESTATPWAASTPDPTATPFTFEAYQKLYQDFIKRYAEYQITENDLRYILECKLYYDEVQAALFADPQYRLLGQEYVWVRHILVSSEDTAKEVILKLNLGDDFATLARQYSIDTGSSKMGGDLGWFTRGQMFTETEQAAFALETINDFTQEPVKAPNGYHIIQLLGRETRPFTTETELFDYWLATQKESVEISTSSDLELQNLLPPLFPLPTPEAHATAEIP